MMKQPNLRQWRIVLVRKFGLYLGTIQAADADAAIKKAVEEFSIDQVHRSRLIAQPAD